MIREDRRVYQTLKEWNECGFIVVYGEKSQKRNEYSQPLFSDLQVEEDEYCDGTIGDIYG